MGPYRAIILPWVLVPSWAFSIDDQQPREIALLGPARPLAARPPRPSSLQLHRVGYFQLALPGAINRNSLQRTANMEYPSWNGEQGIFIIILLLSIQVVLLGVCYQAVSIPPPPRGRPRLPPSLNNQEQQLCYLADVSPFSRLRRCFGLCLCRSAGFCCIACLVMLADCHLGNKGFVFEVLVFSSVSFELVLQLIGTVTQMSTIHWHQPSR